MQDIVDYTLPENVPPRLVVGIVALIFAVAYIFWKRSYNELRLVEKAADALHIPKRRPAQGFRLYVTLAVMVAVAMGAVALGVASGPRLYRQLWGHFSDIGEPDVLFTLGLFACAVALTFFAVREFFRLLGRPPRP